MIRADTHLGARLKRDISPATPINKDIKFILNKDYHEGDGQSFYKVDTKKNLSLSNIR